MSEIFDRWMPFYINDFFGSYAVQCMSERAQLLYLRALCMQWQHGNLPADEDKLRRILGKGVEGFDELWQEVAPCFDLVDGQLVNQRCAEERAKAVGKSEQSARAARAKHAHSGRSADALRTHSERTADALPIQDSTEQYRTEKKKNPPTPSAEGENPPKRSRKRAGEPWQTILERPEYIRLRMSPAFSAAWAEWIEHCQTLGSKAKEPSGPHAAAMLNEAAQNPERYAEALRQAIRSNWKAPHVEALQSRQQAAEPRNASQRNLDVIRNSARQLGLLTERLS